MSQIDNTALLNRFLEYVQIDSETRNELAMAQRLVKDLTDLGCTVTTDDLTGKVDTTGFNVYATLPGDPTLEPMVFAAHMDTVVPGIGVKPRIDADGFVRSDGTTVLGGDDKGGICAIIEAMRSVKDQPHRTIEMVFAVCEECGIHGSRHLDYSRIQSKQGLVLDASGAPSKVMTSAPGQNKITATITGRKSHAGSAPEAGISAIQVAAEAVYNMKLLRIDEETTANIGTFKAEGPTNVVADKAHLVIEVRSRNTEKLVAHSQHIVDCMEAACAKSGATVEADVVTSYLGYHFADDHPLVARILQAGHSIGLASASAASGGGSDANNFNRNGVAMVNMGIGMYKIHTTAEELCIADMENACAVCQKLMLAD